MSGNRNSGGRNTIQPTAIEVKANAGIATEMTFFVMPQKL